MTTGTARRVRSPYTSALGPEKAGNALPKGLDSLVLGQAVGEAAR